MPDYVLPPFPPVCAPVTDGRRFPVRRIFCVGRNYAEHAREMGADPAREEPFFFTKPADALVTDNADTPYPPMTSALHHELELVVALGTGGVDLAAAKALSHVFGYATGLDLTRRDLQTVAKQAGKPWDMGKAFDHSAPIGQIAPASRIGHPNSSRIELTVNGATRQSSTLANMIWSVPEIIATLSRYVRLAPGDLIFTGTPEGVAALQRGDALAGQIEGVGEVRTRIV